MDLFLWLQSQDIAIRAKHIPGCLTVIAHPLSLPNQPITTDWSLHPESATKIFEICGFPTVDMFAPVHRLYHNFGRNGPCTCFLRFLPHFQAAGVLEEVSRLAAASRKASTNSMYDDSLGGFSLGTATGIIMSEHVEIGKGRRCLFIPIKDNNTGKELITATISRWICVSRVESHASIEKVFRKVFRPTVSTGVTLKSHGLFVYGICNHIITAAERRPYDSPLDTLYYRSTLPFSHRLHKIDRTFY